ncbi:hypothetical protein SAMN05192574_10584 [Mucilaginibacter gossypiicola]|uniref:Uncharacterized protein n=1 Tax=Mucilaginibacter gossypiicola TaxID=551995 RepID=A0A1H8LGP5_9SPHI|nr:hypothetical protein SAMN05192574_10584 [Mucilaginibacter gossypiicola]
MPRSGADIGVAVVVLIPVGYINQAGRRLIMISIGTASYNKFTFSLCNNRPAAADDARLTKNGNLDFNWFIHDETKMASIGWKFNTK